MPGQQAKVQAYQLALSVTLSATLSAFICLKVELHVILPRHVSHSWNGVNCHTPHHRPVTTKQVSDLASKRVRLCHTRCVRQYACHHLCHHLPVLIISIIPIISIVVNDCPLGDKSERVHLVTIIQIIQIIQMIQSIESDRTSVKLSLRVKLWESL